MKKERIKKEALDYHSQGRPGKIEVNPTKPYSSQRDLSLAYSPGVAEPCLEIADNAENSYKYTGKGNLVAVISNGTAVLGLGNIGAEASKPVMEGKALLFKIFADIDVFDIEVDATDVDKFVETVKAISPTFGGINLEDIKAPESFEIEKRLIDELDIPVMHDDQHGTAIITCSALINALELADKKLPEISVVVNGAGAAALACTKLFVALGVKKQNIRMFDSKGMLVTSRDLDVHKSEFAVDAKAISLEEAMKGADVFLGLSKGDILTPAMIKGMAENPVVFALANPDPEIDYKKAKSAREDVIVATGRSDNPNQVNNVLGFPYIFRGALDVKATAINEEMKLAAVRAIARITKEPVPEAVNAAYDAKNMAFGREYIIPKPLDPRLLTAVAPAVAKAAMDSGVAKMQIKDWDAYENELVERIGLDNKLIKSITIRAKSDPKRVVFAEADTYKILKAAQIVKDEGIAEPILLGNKKAIEKIIEENNLELNGVEIIDPKIPEEAERRQQFGDILFEKRKRKGYTKYEAAEVMRGRAYFGNMLVETGYADAFISGLTRNYPSAVKPALEIIGKIDGVRKIAGIYILWTKKGGPFFFADTTVNVQPDERDLVEITLLTARAVELFKIEPKIALLSFSNFGSSRNFEEVSAVAKAVQILHRKHPELKIDGELQANFALDANLRMEKFPFSKLGKDKVNTLIFPNLSAGNIAYKLLDKMGDAETVGPILLGLNKPVHILQMGSSVREIVNMVTIAVVDAQNRSEIS